MGLFGFGKKKKVEEAPPKRTPVEKTVERHPMERIDENGQPVFESRLDKRSILWEDHTICKSDFTSVFSSCLGKAFTVQMRMGRSVIGEETRLNLREGLVTIDNQHYPCGYIGLESEERNHPCGYCSTDIGTHDYSDCLYKSKETGIHEADHHHGRCR